MAPARKQVFLLIKLAFAAGAILFLFKSGRLDFGTLINAARPASLPYLLLAAGAFLAAQCMAARRLLLLLAAIDFKTSFVQSFKLTMIGNFFNVVVPGSFGGDVVKAAYLFRDERVEKGRSTGVLMMDRFLGLLGICVLGMLSLAYTLHHDGSIFSHYRAQLTLVLAAIFVTVGSFAVFLLLGSNGTARRWARGLFATLSCQGALYHVIGGVGVTVTARRSLFQACALSILTHLFALFGILVLYRTTGQGGASAIDLAAASSVVFLVSAIPVTPGNVGWTELVASLIWAAVGSKSGAEVFLLWRMVTVLCSLPGAAFLFAIRPGTSASPTTGRVALAPALPMTGSHEPS